LKKEGEDIIHELPVIKDIEGLTDVKCFRHPIDPENQYIFTFGNKKHRHTSQAIILKNLGAFQNRTSYKNQNGRALYIMNREHMEETIESAMENLEKMKMILQQCFPENDKKVK
jgi:mevalonate pyrophosphate decarboxylase